MVLPTPRSAIPISNVQTGWRLRNEFFWFQENSYAQSADNQFYANWDGRLSPDQT